MATLMHDKLIHENVKTLAMFSRIFSYEFLINNFDKMETAFYIDKNNFTCVMYKYNPNKNIMIGFSDKDTTGVYIGHYDDNGNPISVSGTHYEFVPFDGEDNVKEVISKKVFSLFNVPLYL